MGVSLRLRKFKKMSFTIYVMHPYHIDNVKSRKIRQGDNICQLISVN